MKLKTAKKATTSNFDDLLQATKKTKKPASKSKKKAMPTLNPNDELRECVDDYVDAKKRAKIAEADMKETGDAIIEFGREEQDNYGFGGDFSKSYVIPGNDENQVKFVSSNRYTVNADDATEIKGLLGDHFADLMVEKLEVHLKAEVFKDEDLKAEFMELIGERFPDFFDTKATLTVAADFDKNIYRAVDIDGDTLTDLRTFVKPFKPSLR